MKDNATQTRRHLLGVGLDNDDGHKRITRSGDFTLLGGSAETHERMTETVLKAAESLRRRGKSLRDAEHAELADALASNRA